MNGQSPVEITFNLSMTCGHITPNTVSAVDMIAAATLAVEVSQAEACPDCQALEASPVDLLPRLRMRQTIDALTEANRLGAAIRAIYKANGGKITQGAFDAYAKGTEQIKRAQRHGAGASWQERREMALQARGQMIEATQWMQVPGVVA